MRPGQQNKRMRGRGRKQPNGINRVYESNGPDVKVRGTANHIAEKYLALARDAQAAGDPIASENYLQHAEHYFRIIAAMQGQMQIQQPQYAQDAFDDEDDEQPRMNGAHHNGQPVQHQPRGDGEEQDDQQPEQVVHATDDGEEAPRHQRVQKYQPQPSGHDEGNRRERNPRRRRRGGRDHAGGEQHGDGAPAQASSADEAGEVKAPANGDMSPAHQDAPEAI